MDKAIEFPGVGGWKEQSYNIFFNYANLLHKFSKDS
jgi:hypothetical protein